MALYTCSKCGMSVGTMTCGKCGHGKVKSPMCCGQDMSCDI